jgi:hypothetical protein
VARTYGRIVGSSQVIVVEKSFGEDVDCKSIRRANKILILSKGGTDGDVLVGHPGELELSGVVDQSVDMVLLAVVGCGVELELLPVVDQSVELVLVAHRVELDLVGAVGHGVESVLLIACHSESNFSVVLATLLSIAYR